MLMHPSVASRSAIVTPDPLIHNMSVPMFDRSPSRMYIFHASGLDVTPMLCEKPKRMGMSPRRSMSR